MDEYRILMVDDDEDLCEIVRYNFQNEGYAVDIAYSAEEALDKNIADYDLDLLVVMLEGMSGFKLGHIIRNDPKTELVPIVFLTAKSSENDRLTGYSVGADDYITKPFSIRELMARIKVIIRRAEAQKTRLTQIISYNHLKINVTNKLVLLDGKEVPFTKKEFEILKLLLENKNRLFSRDEMLRMVWPEEAFVLRRSIDVNITRIRKKIGIYGQHIVTKLGLGYYFEG
jgi:two-component system alkaline phosphatase synthesis response regulator PhoP